MGVKVGGGENTTDRRLDLPINGSGFLMVPSGAAGPKRPFGGSVPSRNEK